VTADPLLLLGEVDRATARLLRNAAGLTAADLAQPSLLPGWTRGHVLTHVARNADAMVNLLSAARTGEDRPAYASSEARAADIDAGAGRDPGRQLADLEASAQRFAEAAEGMPADAWAAPVETRQGLLAAAVLVWSRLREVEVHHVDLSAGYRAADWSAAYSQRLLYEVVSDFNARTGVPAMVLRCDGEARELVVGERDGAPMVSGPAGELAGWLIGRTPGEGLTVSPGSLPTPPNWR